MEFWFPGTPQSFLWGHSTSISSPWKQSKKKAAAGSEARNEKSLFLRSLGWQQLEADSGNLVGFMSSGRGFPSFMLCHNKTVAQRKEEGEEGKAGEREVSLQISLGWWGPWCDRNAHHRATYARSCSFPPSYLHFSLPWGQSESQGAQLLQRKHSLSREFITNESSFYVSRREKMHTCCTL